MDQGSGALWKGREVAESKCHWEREFIGLGGWLQVEDCWLAVAV